MRTIRRPFTLSCLATLLAACSGGGNEPSAPAVAIDNDDIGGTVNGPAGPEAGVWVIAETRRLRHALREDRRDRRSRPLRRSGFAGGELSGLGARLRARRFDEGRGPSRANVGSRRERGAVTGGRRRRLSRRVLVLDDEGAERRRSQLVAGRRQPVSRVGQEPLVHRLSSDRPARDAHDTERVLEHAATTTRGCGAFNRGRPAPRCSRAR